MITNKQENFKNNYNELDDFIRKMTGSGRNIPFPEMISKAETMSNIVKNFKDDLININTLRNAIIHTKSGIFIAEPHDDTIKLIKYIYNQLTKPSKAEDYAKKVLLLCSETDNALLILNKMHNYNFSQIPVVKNNEITNLLTLETFARWLDKKIENNESFENSKVLEVINESEGLLEYKVIDRSKTIYDVISIFEESSKNGQPLKALLTKINGGKTLKILTLYDLANLYNLIKRSNYENL